MPGRTTQEALNYNFNIEYLWRLHENQNIKKE